jgi:NADPH:quinone reductase-like Zn-dependent oxidoreductase
VKAILCTRFGGPDDLVLADLVDPVAGPGEVLVKVAAVGLNFFDTLILRNQYQVTPPLPVSPGAEVAGTVHGLGTSVDEFEIGQRVVAFIGGNGCREMVVTKAQNAVPIPGNVSDEAAAGIPITYGTAIHGLKARGQLKEGETVAVLGAAGGAGLAAIEIAKLMGARVIAVASNGDKLAFAREHGADEGINYESEDLKTRLLETQGIVRQAELSMFGAPSDGASSRRQHELEECLQALERDYEELLERNLSEADVAEVKSRLEKAYGSKTEVRLEIVEDLKRDIAQKSAENARLKALSEDLQRKVKAGGAMNGGGMANGCPITVLPHGNQSAQTLRRLPAQLIVKIFNHKKIHLLAALARIAVERILVSDRFKRFTQEHQPLFLQIDHATAAVQLATG